MCAAARGAADHDKGSDLHRGARGVPGGRLPALAPFLVVTVCAAFLWIQGKEVEAGFYFLGTSGIVAALGVLAMLGRGGSRLTGTPASSSAVPVGDRTEDRYWKLGILYFNPVDAAVIVVLGARLHR